MEWKLSIGLVDNLDLDPKWIRVYIRDTIGWILSGEILFRVMNPHPDPSLSLWHSNHISVMIRIQIRMYTLGLKVDPDPEYCLERYSLGKWTHIRTHLCLSCILTTYSPWYGYECFILESGFGYTVWRDTL